MIVKQILTQTRVITKANGLLLTKLVESVGIAYPKTML